LAGYHSARTGKKRGTFSPPRSAGESTFHREKKGGGVLRSGPDSERRGVVSESREIPGIDERPSRQGGEEEGKTWELVLGGRRVQSLFPFLTTRTFEPGQRDREGGGQLFGTTSLESKKERKKKNPWVLDKVRKKRKEIKRRSPSSTPRPSAWDFGTPPEEFGERGFK